MTTDHDTIAPADNSGDHIGLIELLIPFARRWRSLILAPIAAGAIAYGITLLMPPTFTATATLLPPQQGGGASAALASLGALSSLAGSLGGGGIKTPADQYVALLQSDRVSDDIIKRFDLMKVYNKEFYVDARLKLSKRATISLGKKDNLIHVEVDDSDPKRAAAMANQYVEELRMVTSNFAVTEAQQRRVFFEAQLNETKNRLTAAQVALQESGIDIGSVQAEPKAAADSFARLNAQLTVAEVKLQTLRQSLEDSAVEVQQQQATVQALRAQIEKASAGTGKAPSSPDYLGKYREFKYQETLFELFARQYETARIDESREGATIQVVDPGKAPEKRSAPRRRLIAIGAAVGCFILYSLWILLATHLEYALRNPGTSSRWNELRQAFARRQRAPAASS